MAEYLYKLTDFALSENGIHLLRNGFNYKTVYYHDLEKATIKRGAEIKNTLLSLIIGVALVSFSILKGISLYSDFNDPGLHRIYIESILLPLFPGLIGSYLVYAALKRGPILQLEQGGTKYKLRLREVQRSSEIESMKLFLNKKLSSRMEIKDGL